MNCVDVFSDNIPLSVVSDLQTAWDKAFDEARYYASKPPYNAPSYGEQSVLAYLEGRYENLEVNKNVATCTLDGKYEVTLRIRDDPYEDGASVTSIEVSVLES